MITLAFYGICIVIGGLIGLAVIAFIIDFWDKCF